MQVLELTVAAAGLFAVFSLGTLLAAPEPPRKSTETLVYIGTYTGGSSHGIYTYHFDPQNGGLRAGTLAAEAAHPSFLALHPNRRFLYAVSEAEGPEGAILAFAIEPATGRLQPLNRRSSRGAGPCHLEVDRSGRFLLAANYGGGSVAVLPISPDGQLGEATAFQQHTGSGPNARRQEKPHAHGVFLDPANRFALVPDLGIDQVRIYRLGDTGSLTPVIPPAASLAPGAGPRHLAFHPQGGFVYVINELLSTVSAFRYNAAQGALAEFQTVSTLPKGFTGQTSTAEVAVHPNGRWLYGSNRGHDSLALFAIDPNSGRLTSMGHVPTRGKTPRHFAIDLSGRWLLAANQDSDTIAVFHIDPTSGELKAAGDPVAAPQPVCLQFWAPNPPTP